MKTNKMMLISISFVLAAILFSSGNTLSISFAQSNTLVQSNDDGDDQTNTGGDNNNSEQQNYDDFQNCLEDEAGTSGFATEDQIRECFAPIYIGSSDDDSSSDDDN
jgi:hypothetical protein